MKEGIEALIRQVITAFFDQYGIKYKNHDRVSLLITRYFGFRLKFISIQKWQVRVSKELTGKLSSHPLADGVYSIFLTAASGRDLNPHQSRQSFNADYHDGMFNDWGIHHLHLNPRRSNPQEYFCDRTGPLLFVRFEQQTAYMLDILAHNSWSNTDLIRIIQKNWPEVLAPRETKVRFQHFTDAEIGVLRNKGYTFGINVDDKSYMMVGHGYTSSGDNFMAGRMADEFWRWAGSQQSLFETNPGAFEQQLRIQLSLS